MRLLSLFTQFITILVAQQLISSWFLFDFFVARDSLTANNLWRTTKSNHTESTSETLPFAVTVRQRKCQNNPTNEATFDKLVFIIIDALGSHFIPIIEATNHQNEDTMPFIMSSLRQQTAMGFVARAATPTVTMPRVKALLSGTIPSFVDVVYNLASDVSNFTEDNIINIAKNQNKTLIFYGDDTWLSLFKRAIFARARETLSLFAHDYTTVDTNVTEKALPETAAEYIDWDFLMLHYLGLDHIGHTFGSNENTLIKTKLGEMDSVIKQIHDNMAKKHLKTLVVVCGDHGMSREGNHGGDTDLEANTAALFLPIGLDFVGPQRFETAQHPHIEQIDIAATLSLVMGLQIPQMSKGVAVEPFLRRLWSGETGDSKLACAYLSNLIQLVNLLDPKELETLLKDGVLVPSLNSHINSNDSLRNIAKNYHSVSRRIQKVLLTTIASRRHPHLLIILVAMVTLLSISNLKRTSLRLLLPTMSKLDHSLCLIVSLLPILMLGSTDFIEYEHKFWPLYSVVSFMLFLGNQRNLAKLFPTIDPIRAILFIGTVLITLVRILIPTSGQEWTSISSHLPSVVSVILFCNFIRQNSHIKKYRGILTIVIGFTIMLTKFSEETRTPGDISLCAVFQKLATLVILLFVVAEIITMKELLTSEGSNGTGSMALIIRKFASGWMCMAFLLARRRNFVFLITNIMMETSLNSLCISLQFPLIVRSIIYFNFAQGSFFSQGNSNSFSSIDVIPAFFGQITYNIYFSIPLVAIATYSTQIYWLLKLFQRIQEDKTTSMVDSDQQQQDNRRTGSTLATTTRDTAENSMKLIRDAIIMRNFLGQSYYMFVCVWLQNHLFIWSVLSPKLVYQFVTNGIILIAIVTICSLSNIRHLFTNDGQSSRKSYSKLDTSVL